MPSERAEPVLFRREIAKGREKVIRPAERGFGGNVVVVDGCGFTGGVVRVAEDGCGRTVGIVDGCGFNRDGYRDRTTDEPPGYGSPEHGRPGGT